MKYVDDFRDPALARGLLERIHRASRRDVRFMEFCGGHTHAILQHGLRQLLPETVHLRAGPGCPVCVTAAHDLDRAIALASASDDVTLATFGDMVRVPGSRGAGVRGRSLQEARAEGADVRVVYSPLDALALAERHPERQVVFLGVGFETTAPGVAATVLEAERRGVANLYLLSLHKLTLPAMRAILEGGAVRLDGVIGPGHVSAILGSDAWQPLPREYGVPCAVSGFEPLDLLTAIADLVEMVETGTPAVRNAYGRGVRAEGNAAARALLERVFEPVPAEWRGIGTLPDSGLALRAAYAHRDALRAFPVEVAAGEEPAGCRCGDVVRGVLDPPECALFGRVCTPSSPVGPCMVSGEGACAAHYRYGGQR